MLRCNARNNIEGFTLLEIMVVVLIISILSAITAPSFLALFNKNKVNDALAQVQGALQQAQREAIRKSRSCTVTLDTTTKKITSSPCVVTGATLNSNVGVETNQTSIQFSYRGTITLSDAGTFVFFSEDNPGEKKCLVISKPLAIIRTGNYTGQIPSNVANPIASNNCEK